MEQIKSQKLSPFLQTTTSLIWYSAISISLVLGWATRKQNYLVAESGIGYWLGIIGGAMMLLLLIYPLRKRFSRWSAIGSVKSWFRIHMILGLLGPLMIVFHSGFKLGSFNSSIALFCMLIVAASGLVGRTLYQRIHHGLYGCKIRFEDYYSDCDLPSLLSAVPSEFNDALVDEFDLIEQQLIQRHPGINRSLGFYWRTRSKIARLQRNLARSKLDKCTKKQLVYRLRGLRSICRLGINEILFSYWHLLHLPLFIMLILSGLAHVAVVHLY